MCYTIILSRTKNAGHVDPNKEHPQTNLKRIMIVDTATRKVEGRNFGHLGLT
jgi:hypothetical protein